ncbi:MAG: ribosome maturation factor RimM [Erysipelotrichaceae bacterium]|nr:ribosome maturation factor RimM [Erysipelotrichaceae bacterium]
MEYLLIGVIVNTFGIKGEVKVKGFTDFPEERFAKGKELYLKYQDEYLKLTIKSVTNHKGLIHVLFSQYEDINLIEKYKGCQLYIHKSQLHKLPKGQYYKFELVGLRCYDQENQCIGEVIDVESLPAHNNLKVLTTNQKVISIPNVPFFVKEVNLQEGRINIHVIEGLL